MMTVTTKTLSITNVFNVDDNKEMFLEHQNNIFK